MELYGNIIYDTGRIYLQMKKSNTEIDYVMISFGGILGIHGLWRIKALKYCTINPSPVYPVYLTNLTLKTLNSQDFHVFSHAKLRWFSSQPTLITRMEIPIYLIWLVVSIPLKNISQLGWWFPIYGKIKNVPNHQPVMVFSDPKPMVFLADAPNLSLGEVPITSPVAFP